MKKILILLLLLFTGCSEKTLMNTPTKRVEMFFENYQTLNEEVISQLTNAIDSRTEFTSKQKEIYLDIMKEHYRSLKYDVKDEIIDGNRATVTVEIEVKDYSKIMEEADLYLKNHPEEFYDNGNYNEKLFIDYRLKQLQNAKNTIKYTLTLSLTNIDNIWKLDNISEIDEQKINGIYDY